MDSTATLPVSDNNLIDNFGIASLIVVIGVCLSWFVLKMNAASESIVLPEIPTFSWSTVAVTADEDLSLLERAEVAFAAGNISEPQGDSALHYYQQALMNDPSSTDAQEGLDRVLSYLMSSAETAVFQNDWTAARSFVGQVLAADADNAEALSLNERIKRFEQVERLMTVAAGQINEGRLTRPEGNNAVATYRLILRMDPQNEAAAQGIAIIAQRLLARAQTAAFAGELANANELIERVKEVDPNASGLAETERMAKQWKQMSADQGIQAKLLAAAQALREDRLVAPEGESALSLFGEVLKQDPNSEAAKRGLDLVASELVSRAWTKLRGQDLAGASAALADATLAGANATALTELAEEIDYQNELANARSGNAEVSLAVSQLTVVKQVTPQFPRRAANKELEGWAEVSFMVSPTGDVVDAKITNSSNELFDRAALSAISGWSFEPYMQDGRPVPVRSGLRFSFQR